MVYLCHDHVIKKSQQLSDLWIFWDVMQCSSESASCFIVTYYFHLQAGIVNQVRKKQKPAASLAGILLGLLLDPEDGSSMLPENVVLCLNYKALQGGKLYSSCCQIFIFVQQSFMGLCQKI
jgi:hypothetical protein